MFDIIVGIAMLIFIFVIATVLLSGKGGFLIAGYNMMPKEKKAKIDEVGLCKFMGKVLLGIFLSVLLIFAEMITKIALLNTLGISILAISIIVALIWSKVYYKV